MCAKSQQNAIGFPPPLLGDQPFRLAVLAESANWVALDKPAGIGVREHPWDENCQNLDSALNAQLKTAKPELLKRDAELFGSVYHFDAAISGVSIFAMKRDALAEFRNDYGSEHLSFRFVFVSRTGDQDAVITADAPLLQHNTKLKMIPSSAKGKKAQTTFQRLGTSASGWSLWEATTNFIRPHQIRAHAAVHGIPVMGDELYDGAPVPTLRDLMPKKRGPGMQAAAFDGIPLHLASVTLPNGVEVEAPLPKPFEVLLRRLGL